MIFASNEEYVELFGKRMYKLSEIDKLLGNKPMTTGEALRVLVLRMMEVA